jgi:hypothetical protein
LAEKRGFVPGYESGDWLEAEARYNEMLIAAYIEILQEDGQMTFVGLLQLAGLIGIEGADKLYSETELIHAVQDAVKHRPCCRTKAIGQCQDIDCMWRSQCMKLTAAWHIGVHFQDENNGKKAVFID